MSSCGGNCGCGSSCKCGDSCNGCGEFSDLSYLEKTTTVAIISGVVPVNKYHACSSEMIVSDGSHACKCGSNCTCDPCKC